MDDLIRSNSGRRATSGLVALALTLVCAQPVSANPLVKVLADFEGGSTNGAVAATTTDSSSGGATNSTFANVSEGGSRRLQMTDSDGSYNGGYITFPGAITQPGYYLVTTDIKVDNASAAIGSFGIGVVEGGPTTAKISDVNAGYIPNLAGTGDAALGYQTIGAAIEISSGGTFPRDLTLYFSTDISGNSYNASTYDGNYNGTHRGGVATWASGSSNAVYFDNVKLIGPGNFGEERHLWISLGDGYTDLNKLENLLVQAKNNNINCVDILVRYRADAYYVPNRWNTAYPNPEPFGTKVGGKAASATNDPLQYAIDRGHELGLKVFAAFSCFLVTDGSSGSYPGFLPSGSIMWYYNGGAPREMIYSDPSAEGLWADVSRSDVRNYTKNVFMDLISNYDVDGVIFDRIRYPNQEYSYNPQGLSEMGISGTPSPTDATFKNARRDAVTNFLHACYEAATTAKPWLIVGTVPVAYGDGLNDTYNGVFQHWPRWTGRKTANRAISFGCCDLFQPQFYRLWNSTTPYEAPASNTRLMNKAQYGDLAAYSLDLGLMPGAFSNIAPLFYHPNSGDTNQSNANAQNITDGRALSMNGFGFYPATTTINDMSLIRDPAASTAGADVLGSPAPFTDYLFKANFDKIAPKSVTNFAAAANADGTVDLSWTAPAAASDGEGAARYLLYKSTTSPVKEYWGNLITKSTISGSTTSFKVPVDFEGDYYYRIVPVDDYNNRGPAVQIGPISVAGEPLPPADVIVDNPQAVLTGTWSLASGATDKYGSDYRYKGVGTGTATVAFNASISTGGTWSVYEWHPQGSNRATNARHAITHAGGSSTVLVNQVTNGGKWNKLGDYTFNGGADYSVTIDDYFSGTVIMADAIRWSYVVQPPAAPSGLTATAASQTSMNLSWTDNSTNERNTVVSRSTTAGGPYTDIATLGINQTSYTDTGLTANTSYYYVVRMTNSAGSSGNSAEASGTTLPWPPAAPSNLSASAASQTQINLAWQDNSDNETNFVVSRSTTAGGPYTQVATLGANTTSYAATGLSADTTYYFVVKATNSGGSSGNSNEASARTLPNPPSAPSGLAATAVGQSRIDLTWTDNSTNESNFVVGRSTTSGGPYTDIATLGANVTSYSNTGLSAATTYYYVVRATNSGGSSANSNQASATTEAADYVVDNPAAAVSGSWSTGTGATDKYGADYRFKGQGTGAEYLTYVPNLSSAGAYDVYEWHPAGTNRTAGAPHVIAYNGGTDTVLSNQQVNGGKWNLLGRFNFASGTTGNVKITDGFADAGQVVLADAVRLVYAGAAVPPATPTGLTATAASSSQINLAWNAVSNESGYTIGRSTTSGGPYTDIATVGANVTSYANTGLASATTYYYVVRANNVAGSSANSTQAGATTLSSAPAAPSSLAATAVSKSQINLTWVDNSSNESNFVVMRSTTAGGPYSDIATLGSNVTSYSNTGLAGNTRYYYRVRATNSGGSSAPSNEASALTWPNDIIVDNANSSFTASSNWSSATSATDKYGTNYRYRSTASVSDSATWNYSAPQARSYQIYAWWTQGTNRSKTAPYVVHHSSGSTTVQKNQQANGGTWQSLGTFSLASGNNKVQLSCWTTKGYVVVADAVKIVAR